MFMGYSINRWIGLGEYILIISVLSIGAVILSAYLTKYSMKEKFNRNKLYNNNKKYKNKKKQIFFDVA